MVRKDTVVGEEMASGEGSMRTAIVKWERECVLRRHCGGIVEGKDSKARAMRNEEKAMVSDGGQWGGKVMHSGGRQYGNGNGDMGNGIGVWGATGVGK